jgi:subtilase family serine protease
MRMRKSNSAGLKASVKKTSYNWILCLVCLAICPAAALAQDAKPAITAPVNERVLVTLEGNTPAAAMDAESDRGPVADEMQMEHMLLALKRAPETEARFEKLIGDMHDPNSPEYHRWLTPQQLAARFGIPSQDLETIRTWLGSYGFQVNHVYQNGFVIDFSGTAANVREAFHTEIHNVVLANGERHISNISDPQIPAALAPAVQGVASLHNFFPRSRAIQLGPVSYNSKTNTWQPHFNVNFQGTTFHTLGPYDFATIYDLLPLWKRGITGKGVTIAAVEVTNLAHPGDWNAFRNVFGLDQFT